MSTPPPVSIEETYDVPLPVYKGRLSQDWSTHETRIKAWLRLQAIPLHSREAADVLLLSLDPSSPPFLSLIRSSPSQSPPTTFAEISNFLKDKFDTKLRKKLAQESARNALDGRFFKERGRRGEMVKDLLGDLEGLWERAGVVGERERMEGVVRAFIDHPRAVRAFSKCATYNEIIQEAFRFESQTLARDLEERRPRPSPTRVASTSPLAYSTPPSPSKTHNRPTSPSPLRPLGLEIPTSLTPSRGGGIPGGGGGPSSSPPSTIEEATEEISPATASGERDRPDNPTPGAASGSGMALGGGYFVVDKGGDTIGGGGRQYDSVASRMSLGDRMGLPIGFGGEREEFRSRSVDFGPRLGERGGFFRPSGAPSPSGLVGSRDEDSSGGGGRSSSTPPYVSEAIRGGNFEDTDDEEEEEEHRRRSARERQREMEDNDFAPAPRSQSVPLGELEGKRIPRKLVKRVSGRSASAGKGLGGREGSVLSTEGASTATGSAGGKRRTSQVVKGWFVRKKDKDGPKASGSKVDLNEGNEDQEVMGRPPKPRGALGI